MQERFKGAKLLQQILEPSTEIHKDYATWLIRATDGGVVTGLIVKREDAAVHVLPNPLKPKEIRIVKRADIEAMKASTQSTMPKGLLMTYEKDEILDLLRFVQSGGNP